MSYRIFLPLLGILFVFTTGASFIDKETKARVMGLEEKITGTSRQEMAHHVEVMRLLREQREQLQILIQRVDALQRQTSPALSALSAAPSPSVPVAVEEPQKTEPEAVQEAPVAPGPAIEAAPSAVPAVALQPPTIVEAPPVATAPQVPVVAPPAVASSPSSENLRPLILLIFGLVVVLLIAALVRAKKGEERLRKIIWKSEMGALREELSQPKPKSNSKIQVTGNVPKSHVS